MTKLNSIIFILIMALLGITINTDKAYAKNSIYGRLDIALSSEDTSSGSYTDVKSHASRVGFKGSQTFDNGVALFTNMNGKLILLMAIQLLNKEIVLLVCKEHLVKFF